MLTTEFLESVLQNREQLGEFLAASMKVEGKHVILVELMNKLQHTYSNNVPGGRVTVDNVSKLTSLNKNGPLSPNRNFDEIFSCRILESAGYYDHFYRARKRSH